ncbi:hypothetical protein, partial [Ruegeria lacuscaerulensis]|uniref:hypothetical protein n=1 Tax=Ruegeria lacuscaerulensis TaxID=55218 RepID=UPI001BE3FF0F
CLFVLSEGGGRAFPLTSGGVWLVQIPPDPPKKAKGSSILRERKKDRHPNGQIITAWADHDPKPLPRLA